MIIDPQWEARFLAACLMDPGTLERGVTVADMGVRANADILGAMLAVRSRAEDVDLLSVRRELERTGKGVNVDKLLRLTETVEVNATAAAARVRELSAARRLVEAALTAQQQAEGGDVSGAADTMRRAGAEDATLEDRVYTHREMLTATAEAILKEHEGAANRFVALGLGPSVDGSFKAGPGDLCVIGAAPNVGKSWLILGSAASLAERDVPCGIVSVEDPVEDAGARRLAMLSGVDPEKLWHPPIAPTDWQRLMSAMQDSHIDAPIAYAKIKSRRLDGVVAAMTTMARTHRARVLFVDYLQAIRHPQFSSKLTTRECINDILATLQATAAQLGVALVLASQLARDKSSPFKEPHLHDLKESASIEESAQCVVLLWRTTDDQQARDYGVVRAKVAKVKRARAGKRFAYARHPRTYAMVELEDWSPDDEGVP